MSIKAYEILGRVNECPNTTMFKVLRVIDSQIYSLKRVRIDLDDDQQQQVIKELRQLATLSSPYLTKQIDVFYHQDTLWYP